MASSGEPFACLTCYDAATARWLERGGVHVLLVGDTAAEMVLGHDSTIHMPMELSIALTAAVKRGAPGTVVMSDMPFMSYHLSESESLRNAGRFMTEGRSDLVKLEVTSSHLGLVRRLTEAGVPVCAHIGSRPQTSKVTGGYAAAGRSGAEASSLVDLAGAMGEAGAVMLLIEAVPHEVAERVVSGSAVPVIGIGAGPAPHGQILVLHDLLGLSDWQPPFATKLASVGEQIRDAAEGWVNLVAGRQVPARIRSSSTGSNGRPEPHDSELPASTNSPS